MALGRSCGRVIDMNVGADTIVSFTRARMPSTCALWVMTLSGSMMLGGPHGREGSEPSHQLLSKDPGSSGHCDTHWGITLWGPPSPAPKSSSLTFVLLLLSFFPFGIEVGFCHCWSFTDEWMFRTENTSCSTHFLQTVPWNTSDPLKKYQTLPANAKDGDVGSIPGSGRSSGEGNGNPL